MKYPMHEKLKPLQPQSQAIGDFLEWCGEQGIELASYSNDTQMFPHRESREAILARYFEIDLKVLEKEKRQMLAQISVQNV